MGFLRIPWKLLKTPVLQVSAVGVGGDWGVRVRSVGLPLSNLL